MALPDLTGQNIQDTYQRVIQKGADGQLYDGTGSAQPIKIEGNNVRISGSLIAQDYIVSSSVTNVTFQQQSGSTIFGDSIDDTHQFTGSLKVTGSITGPSASIGRINTNVIDGGSNSVISLINNAISIDTLGSIGLDSGIGTIVLQDTGVNQLAFDMDGTTGAQIIELKVAGDDLIFKSQGGDSLMTLKSEGQTEIHGNITASGTISASGDLYAGEIYYTLNREALYATSQNNITVGWGYHLPGDTIDIGRNSGDSVILINGNITASGDISASGEIIASQYKVQQHQALSFHNTHGVGVGTSDQKLKLNATAITLDAPVTASGDISASGTSLITAHTYKAKDQYKINDITVIDYNFGPVFGSTTSGAHTKIQGHEGITFSNNVTASGDISSSSDIHASNIILKDDSKVGTFTGIENTDTYIQFDDTDTRITLKVDADDTIMVESGQVGIGGANSSKTLTVHGEISASGYIATGTHITASGNISASGNIFIGDVLNSNGINTIGFSTTNNSVNIGPDTTTPVKIYGNITASSNISSSARVTADDYYMGSNAFGSVASGTTRIADASLKTKVFGTNINLAAPVTASGDISASGDIIANNLILSGDFTSTAATAQFTNITASGDISSSAQVIADTINVVSSITGSYPKLTDSGGDTIFKISGVVQSNTAKLEMGDVDNAMSGEVLILDNNGDSPVFYNSSAASVRWGIDTTPADLVGSGASFLINTSAIAISSSGHFVNTGNITTNQITASGTLTVAGDISSSATISSSNIHVGDISATGIEASTITTTNTATLGNSPVYDAHTITGRIRLVGHVTASNSFDIGGNIYSAGNLSLTGSSGQITASGDISSSLYSSVISGTGSFHKLIGDTASDTGLEVDGYVKAYNVTSSGNISSSADLIGANLTVTAIATTERFVVDQIDEQNTGMGIKIMHNITASGHISASGEMHSHIGHLVYQTASIVADGNVQGDIVKFGGSTTVAGAIYAHTGSGWSLAHSGSAGCASSSLALAVGTNSSTHGMLLRGMANIGYDPGGQNGCALYLESPGSASSNVSATTGHVVRVVGWNYGAETIYFNPDNTWVELA